jgi:hypothetical protein
MKIHQFDLSNRGRGGLDREETAEKCATTALARGVHQAGAAGRSAVAKPRIDPAEEALQ